jgi:Lectin C-type domain
MVRCRAALLALVAGCFSPRPPEGAPCESPGDCPSLQHCVLGRCSSSEAPPIDAAELPDAANDAAPIDAMPDATPLACTAAGLACGGTPVVFTCGGHCWVRCPSNVNWNTASQACAGWQGALGQIDDATEQGCVAMRSSGATWIGLRQDDAAAAPAQGWGWNSAAIPVVYSRWQPGTPDDQDGDEDRDEQCGKLQDNDTWDDVTCAAMSGFLCERS